MQPNFIIIGAQKSGTTSLFEALSSHPDIYMPPEKELQFFNSKRFEEGLNGYREFFRNKGQQALCGEASPQYMCNRIAADRITANCPDTKLIAILRDPVERAFSHHRMTARRQRTRLSFEEAVRERLRSPIGTPESPDMDHDYLLLGEYGRMIEWYRPLLEKGNLQIILLPELQTRPLVTLGRVMDYLGLDPAGLTKINVHAHKGGCARFNNLDRLLRSSLIKSFGRSILSPQQRRAFAYWWETKGNVKVRKSLTITAHVTSELREYFMDDTRRLVNLLGCDGMPWSQHMERVK